MNNYHKLTKLLVILTGILIAVLGLVTGCTETATNNLSDVATISNKGDRSIDITIVVRLEEDTDVATFLETILEEFEQISNACVINGSLDSDMYIRSLTDRFDNISLKYYESADQLEQSQTRAPVGGTNTRIERCCTACYGTPRCSNCSSKTARDNKECYYRIINTSADVDTTTTTGADKTETKP